ncbi:MAG: endopeptidase La [Firmicutes bacterium]|nr:endopeptidase La [Bacillota bacterium]HOB35325.1 endopeptidase La [Bacillota bacterium]HPZ91282.1 endopeptidase La [Bacillota bacterium]HQE02654.1 endopeptidase La [Bacillota bacterium]
MSKTKTTRVIPLLALRGILVFPDMIMHLDVGREKSVAALERAMVDDNEILLVSQRQANLDDPQPEDLFSVGTVASIKQVLKLPGGTVRVLVEGLARARVVRYLELEPLFLAEAELLAEDEADTPEHEAYMRALLHQFERYIKLSKKIPPDTLISISEIDEPGRLADLITGHLSLKVEQKQQILEAADSLRRLELLTEILARENEMLEVERRLGARVRKQMEKNQREYYLREQLKAIQKELGERDGVSEEADAFRQTLASLKLPDKVREKIAKEIDRLERTPPASPENVVLRNYLEWTLSLPWGKESRDRLDLKKAANILDQDHYGLEKVKERILEFLAVRKLAKKLKSPIICLIGPPGVGKTSLAKSVARSLQREFVRISLGGVRDEAEIRGHRRTYVGAMPGRIIQGMRQAGTANPVFLMDEIDKMSTDFRGDPSAALLEVLDPEQNNSFSDHYIEVPFDLSKVLFITTANAQHPIPQPLQDRMEIIYISGYTEEEKVEIVRRHLLPKLLKEHGLSREQMKFSQHAVRAIIRHYTREAGVRDLERHLARVCRKVAREVVDGHDGLIRITVRNLHQYLGAPRYKHREHELEPAVGIATGLAWTQFGGEVLDVEATVMPGTGSLTLTGKLGDVMKESAQAALSFVRSRSRQLGLAEDFFQKHDIHIHVPEGAIPKDGPSAGVTIASALYSAVSGKRLRRDIAMTGEITLQGRVLPVGGIKEKVLAAHRNGIDTVILPRANEKDSEDIPANIRRRIKLIWVDEVDSVLSRVIIGHED